MQRFRCTAKITGQSKPAILGRVYDGQTGRGKDYGILQPTVVIQIPDSVYQTYAILWSRARLRS